MADEGGTIKARMTLDTKGVGEGADDAKKKVSDLGKSLADLFGREPVGERRFRGVITSTIRDLAGMQGGAQGAAQAVGTLFERLSLGTGIGAVLAAAGTAMVVLVRHGEELRKVTSESSKEMQRLGREAKTATEAEGFDALANKAQRFHKEQRKARDEEAKDREHHGRRIASLAAREAFAHPLELFETGKRREEAEKTLAQHKKADQEATAQLGRLQELAVASAREQVDLAQSQLTGTKEDVELHKLRLETLQREKAIQTSALTDEQRTQATGALQKEIELRKELIHAHQEQEDVAVAGQLKQSELQIESAALDERRAALQASALTQQQKSLAMSHESVEAAKEEQAAAEERVRQAQEQLRIAQDLSQEERDRAQAELQSAEAGAMKARAGVIQAGAAAGEAAGAELERAGAEEEMSPKEKMQQYQERYKKFEGLRRAAARRRLRPDLIEAPEYGEAEYDPTRRYKAAVAAAEAGGLEGREGALAGQQPVQQNIAKSAQHLESIDKTLLQMREMQQAAETTKQAPAPTGSQPTTAPSGGTTAPTQSATAPTPKPGPAPTPAPTPQPGPAPTPSGAGGGAGEAGKPPRKPERSGASFAKSYPIAGGETLAEQLKGQQPAAGDTVEAWRNRVAKMTREGQLRGAGIVDRKGNIDERRAAAIAQQFNVSPDSPNLDWRFMAQSSKNIQANVDYWSQPGIQDAVKGTSERPNEGVPIEKPDELPDRLKPYDPNWRSRAFPGHPAESEADKKQAARDDQALHLPHWMKPIAEGLGAMSWKPPGLKDLFKMGFPYGPSYNKGAGGGGEGEGEIAGVLQEPGRTLFARKEPLPGAPGGPQFPAEPQQPQPQQPEQPQPQQPQGQQPTAPVGGNTPLTKADMEEIMSKYWS